jgi:SWI/SNF-related matrix-associated actin-dependent regulator 1 of chromatin subfamily A
MEEFRKFTPEEQEKMRQEALRKRAEREKRIAEEAAKEASSLLSQQLKQTAFMQPLQLKRTIPEGFFNPLQVEKKPAASGVQSKGPKAQLQLTSSDSFEITATPGVIGACKALRITTPPLKDGKIVLQLADRTSILAKLAFNERPLTVHDIPKTVLAAFEPNAIAQRQAALNSNINLQNTISEKLLHNLFPFQVEGVKNSIRRNGRILIADEMGLGKSLQALAVASFYRLEWPLLIVAPASMVANWREQVFNWIPDLPKEQVQVIFDGKIEAMTGDITILSYDLSVRLADMLRARQFRVIICDECHALRNSTTKRSKTMVPILQAAQRVILLSGTPALSRPYELHPQISVINPKLFPKSHEYGMRYCDGHETHFGWDFKGTSNATELNVVLEHLIMIRRTKEQVLTQLPPKLRQQVFLEIPKEAKKRLKASTEELFNTDLLVDEANVDDLLRSMSSNSRYIRLYQETAKAKMPGMLEYVADLLDSGHKFIVFAHHIETLEAFSNHLTKQVISTERFKCGLIRFVRK